MTTESHANAMKRYNATLRSFICKFSKTKDKDVISKLESVSNITQYIRELIRRDIGD